MKALLSPGGEKAGARIVSTPIRICHVINWLNIGGAEMMLLRLVQGSDPLRFEHEVVSLIDLGPIADRLRALGVRVTALGMRQGIPDPFAVVRLAKLFRRLKPDIIQTWLFQSDLVGGIAAVLAGRRNLIWGIHLGVTDLRSTKRLTRLTTKVCALLSGWLPSRIVCCSEVAAREQFKIGYKPEKFVIIPNGFDISQYRPNAEARDDVRKTLGLPKDCFLIGMFARFHPQKDHSNFFEAARVMLSKGRPVDFVLCGSGVTNDTEFFARQIKSVGNAERFHLLGPRSDIPRLAAALDVATLSSSHGEAFPLFLGEAMACGVPCVATDVGETAALLDRTGRVVPPRNPQALADAWQGLMTIGAEARHQLGCEARARVVAHFELSNVVSRYESLYLEVMEKHFAI